MDSQQSESRISKKSTSDIELDVDNAYRITERLAFPRLFGFNSQPGLKFVHTKRDNMSLVSKEGIKTMVLLCTDVINRGNNNFKS